MTAPAQNQLRPEHRLRLPSAGMSSVIVVAVSLGGVALSLWWPYHCEQQVIRQFEARFVSAEASYEYVGPELLHPWSDRQWLKWLHRVQGLRLYDQLFSPYSGFIPAGPATSRSATIPFPDLAALQRCTSLELSWMTVDDAECLRGAASCESLRVVRLASCRLTADALRGLDGLNGLREIRLERCSVEGNLLELPLAPSLQTLRGIDARFRTIDVSGPPELRRLEAKNCSFSDEGVAMLLEAPHLEVLMVPNGTLTDDAIDDLLELRDLRYLDLRYNGQMTRAGLERLADLPRLQTVNVYRTMADSELTELQQVLPQAKATYSP